MHTPAPGAAALRASSVVYAGVAENISAVRADLRELLDGCPMADDMILCASELATNAALHSYSGGPGGTFTVRGEIRPGAHVRIEVEDNGGPWTPASSDAERGHGLDIISALADGWGVEGGDEGRTVWAWFNWPNL
jgi:anti-sigma regulatory factor (Ser/Thr protein kinase)